MTNISIRELIKEMQETEKPLSTTEAAEYLGITKSYLYKLTFGKKIQFYKPSGGKIYFKKSDLDNYAFRNRKATDSEIESEAINYAVSH